MRKLFTCILALIAGVGTLFAGTTASGTCGASGNNLIWTLDDNGVLTISGTGEMENWGNKAFVPWNDYRTAIQTVEVEAGVTSIGNHAFDKISATKVFLPEGLLTIGIAAIQDCDNLTSLSIPSTVTQVDCYAFDASAKLTQLVFYPLAPPTVTGAYSGLQLQKQTTIYIPDDVYTAGSYGEKWGGGNYTFQQLAANKVQVDKLNYHFNMCRKQAQVRSGDYTFTRLTVPSSVEYDGYTYPVTSIGASAFRGMNGLLHANVSEGVTEIEDGAFMETGLIRVTLPASLTSLGGYAFAYLKSEEITVTCNAETPPVCGDNCFYGLNNLNKSQLTVPGVGYKAYTETQWSAFATMIAMDYTQGLFTFKIDGENHTASLSGFDNANSPAAVTIPNTITVSGETYPVTSIGKEAFAENTIMTSVVIPDNVTVIGAQAFRSCTALSQVTLPTNIPEIGNSCFVNCDALPVVDGIRYVDYILLELLDKTKNSYTIKSNTRFINHSAFRECTNLRSIVLPNKVEWIGDYAFSGCTALEQIDLPEGLITIGNRVFHQCRALKKCTIPESVQMMYKGNYEYISWDEDNSGYISTFSKCDALDTIIILSKTIGEATDLYEYFDVDIPNYVLGDKIERIGERAFYGRSSSLKSIRFPSSLRVIGNSAFAACMASFTELELPNSVIEIEDKAFWDAYTLKHIHLGNSLVKIGEMAFLGTPLQELNLPASIKTIGDMAFGECSSLQSIACEAIEPPTLGDKCFGGVNKEIPVTVPFKSITVYRNTPGWDYFSNYQQLPIVLRYEYRDDNLTATVIPYEEGAPYCGDIVIPETVENDGKTYTVTTIGRNAFYDCTELTSIAIPPTVQNIYTDAFWGCTNLQAVNISDVGKWCTVSISADNYLALYAQPLSYSKRLLLNGELITDLVIPDEATLVNYYTFANDTALESLTLPASMRTIQTAAFMGCKNIKTITCFSDEVPFTNFYCFDDIDEDIPVYVPAQSVEAYKTTGEWVRFTNILPLRSSDIDPVTDNRQSTIDNRKFIKDGQLLILRGDKIYTVTGQEYN